MKAVNLVVLVVVLMKKTLLVEWVNMVDIVLQQANQVKDEVMMDNLVDMVGVDVAVEAIRVENIAAEAAVVVIVAAEAVILVKAKTVKAAEAAVEVVI